MSRKRTTYSAEFLTESDCFATASLHIGLDKEGHYNFSLATIEKDIPLFIDYLDFPPSYIGTDFSINIHNNILKNIYSDTHLYKKFKWVASYYVLKLNEHDNESLLIPKLLNL